MKRMKFDTDWGLGRVARRGEDPHLGQKRDRTFSLEKSFLPSLKGS